MMRASCLIIAAALVAAGCGGSGSPDVTGTDGAQDSEHQPPRPAVALPGDLPDDVPLYPGSTPVHVGTSGGGIRQSPQTSIQLETADPPESVEEFYAAAMAEHSWTMVHSGSRQLHGDKGERYLNVTITPMPNRPGTVRISVLYNRPESADDAPQP